MVDRLRAHAFWLWIAFLAAVAAVGGYAALLVLTQGLVVTNLSDLAPWGQWIIVDLSCIGLAAGAFSLSAVTHLLGRKRFEPLARIAVFIGLLGYTGALLSLAMDIGQPSRFWHGWVFWNVHSLLWEVTMCITFYFLVLLLEVYPLVVELPFLARFKRLRALGRRVHRFAPVLAVIGLGLSLLHQSSLGGTYGVVAGRVELFRSTMPLLFIVSAVGAGIAFTVQMTLVVQWLKKRILVPRHVLFLAGQIAGAVLLVYLYMRFWDATVSNYNYVLAQRSTEAEALIGTGRGFFAISFRVWERLLGGLVAAALLIVARIRQSVMLLMVGSGLAMAGLIANRWNTTMFAFTEPLSLSPPLTDPLVANYTPHAVEWAVSVGIVAGLTLVFSLGMRYLPAYRGVAPAGPAAAMTEAEA
mgnify:CR=1 FL=1